MIREKVPEGKKVSKKVFSITGGLSGLVGALQQSIGAGKFILGVQNITIEKSYGGYILQGTDPQGNSIRILSKKIVSTVGAYSIRNLFPFFPDGQLKKIENLHYTRVIEVSIGFNNWKGRPLDAFGALIPNSEKRDILGILFMSTLFKGRSPENGALVTVFMGGVRRQDLCELNDEGVRERVEKELKNLLDLNEFNPDLFKIIRHNWAIPQYRADSGERYETVDWLQKEYPGLILAGNLRDGIGMADRIRQGKMIADTI